MGGSLRLENKEQHNIVTITDIWIDIHNYVTFSVSEEVSNNWLALYSAVIIAQRKKPAVRATNIMKLQFRCVKRKC